MDGERLTAEDAKAVVEKLLVYHPNCEDKVGCGLDSIMVSQSLHNLLYNSWIFELTYCKESFVLAILQIILLSISILVKLGIV